MLEVKNNINIISEIFNHNKLFSTFVTDKLTNLTTFEVKLTRYS